jgi:hypothetical protein
MPDDANTTPSASAARFAGGAMARVAAAAAADTATFLALDEFPDVRGGVLGEYEIGPASDDPYEIGEATWSTHFYVSRVKAIPLNRLVGGASLTPSQRTERARVLATRIQHSGVLSPIYVNDLGEVLEGQHRLEAMHILEQTDIPAVVLTPDYQELFMEERGYRQPDLARMGPEERVTVQADFRAWQRAREQQAMDVERENLAARHGQPERPTTPPSATVGKTMGR